MSDDARFNLIRRGNVLVPADAFAEDYISQLPQEKEIIVERISTKNPREVRWYFAMLRTVLDNTDRYKTTEELRYAIMLGTGQYDVHFNEITGRHHKRVRSLANMDQDEFRAHKELALKWIADNLGIDAAELMREVDGTQKLARYPR